MVIWGLKVCMKLCWEIKFLYSKRAFEEKKNFILKLFSKTSFWHFLEQKKKIQTDHFCFTPFLGNKSTF